MANTHIPIVLIDIEGFSRWKEVAQKRAVLQRFDRVLEEGLKPFIGFANPREVVGWHSTGDGYYITMQNFPPVVAMRFAVDLEENLTRDNRLHPDFPLRLRIGLCLGDVEWVGRHQLSQAYIEANRLVDHAWTRELLERRIEQATALVASTLFMDEWRACDDKESAALKIPDAPPWTQVKFDIKHGEKLPGYMWVEKPLLDTIVAALPPTVASDSTTVDLSPWLASLLDRTDTLEIRGIGSGAGRQREAGKHPIEQLYTPLRSQGSLDKRKGWEEQKTVSLAELLPGYPRLLIEGQPGAGKTTFLKMVAAMLAKDLLKIPNPQGSDWRAQYLGMQESPRYPLFLRLSELAILLADDPKTIRDDRHRLLALLGGDREADWLTLLEAGQAILLLDGLDEVTGDALRRRVIWIVQDALRHWSRCPVLVTSRPFGVGQMKGLDFQHVRIEPFDDKEIHTFIDRWSAALHGRSDGGRDSLSAAKHQEILLHAIMNRPAIRQLATNPVMLTCLCVVHWNEGRLPEGRARVYQAVINWLIPARLEMRKAAGYTDSFAEEAFATLALAMMETGRSSGTQAVFDLEEGAEAVLSLVSAHFSHITTKPRQLAWAREWLDFECQGSGIVEEVGERRLKFWHLTFQEFLAALALSGMGDGEVKGEDWWPRIEPVLDNPQWRETVSLLPGTLWDKGGRRRVDRLLERVLAMGGEKPDLLMNARMAGIMGRLLEPMSAYQYPVPQGVEQSYQAVLQHSLDIFTLDGAQRVPIAIRLDAAEALGRQGDPRLQQQNWIEVPGTGGWLLGKYLVTVAEYRLFVEAEGYQNQRWWCEAGWTIRMEENWANPRGWDGQTLHPNHPVTEVSWFEAMAYCRWLSEREKRMIRLPVETLWAKAATPRKGEYPWGEAEPTPELASFGGNVPSPTPVGLYPAGDGPLGHCDLAGNVWEWQSCSFKDKDVTMDMPLDPVVAEDDMMILLGGSWLDPADFLYAAGRVGYSAEDQANDTGFRVAVAPKSKIKS